MRDVTILLTKKKVHDSTKYAAPKNSAIDFLYLPARTVKLLGNPNTLRVTLQNGDNALALKSDVLNQSSNAAVAANGASNEQAISN